MPGPVHACTLLYNEYDNPYIVISARPSQATKQVTAVQLECSLINKRMRLLTTALSSNDAEQHGGHTVIAVRVDLADQIQSLAVLQEGIDGPLVLVLIRSADASLRRELLLIKASSQFLRQACAKSCMPKVNDKGLKTGCR